MNAHNVETLIKLNDIDKESFEGKLYNTMILGVFEALCKDIKKSHTKIEEKEKYRKSNDKIAVTKRIVKKYVGCHLYNEDYERLSLLLRAFFSKTNKRKRFDFEYKKKLVEIQNCKCNICGKKISVKDSHLDHIIPWDYVGDELEDNYQMLCETCNKRKGTAAYFEISMMLLNRS